MRWLIDGYNLMHILGLVRPRGQRRFAKCRRNLVHWVSKVHGPEAHQVCIVFDGQNSERETVEVLPAGPTVIFSRDETADDLIERILEESRSGELTLISNDRRLQQAAKRWGSKVWSCDQYLEWTLAPDVPEVKQPKPAEKPTEAQDVGYWKQQFSHLDEDPELRRFNQIYRDFGI
jgi:predicted RNA-binding protein with PIN domain